MIQQDNLSFLGHGSLYVSMAGKSLLVDGNFSKKILCFIGRQQPLVAHPEKLKPDAFLITHAHYDSLDLFTYKYFPQSIPFIAPVGMGSLIHRFLKNPVVELKVGEKYELGSLSISALPNRHRGFRLGFFGYGESLSYLISGPKKIYVNGDSAYGPHFKEIAKHGPIDIATLPLGSPRRGVLMRHQNMNQEEMLEAFDDLQAKLLIPTQWEGFELPLQNLKKRREDFEKLLGSSHLKNQVKFLQPGEALPLS